MATTYVTLYNAVLCTVEGQGGVRLYSVLFQPAFFPAIDGELKLVSPKA